MIFLRTERFMEEQKYTPLRFMSEFYHPVKSRLRRDRITGKKGFLSCYPVNINKLIELLHAPAPFGAPLIFH